MEIQKITEDFNFYKEGVDYILELGNITREKKREVALLITEIENSEKLSINSTCGCSTVGKIIVDKHTQSVKISYNECDSSFAKTLVMKYNNVRIGVIKIKGKCQ